MKKIILFLFILYYPYIVVSQNNIKIKVKANGIEKLENVVVCNLSNKYFNYTNSNGEIVVVYSSLNDIIKFIYPFYEETSFSIDQILKNNNSIELVQKTINLDEVLLIKKGSLKKEKQFIYKPKQRKNYYSKFISSGGAMVSSYVHKKGKFNKLKSISFFIDTSSFVSDGIQIRPILKKIIDNNLKYLAENNEAVVINKNNKEINIELTNMDLVLKENEKYYFGFELIDNSKQNEVAVLSFNSKKAMTYIKSNPVAEFVPLEKVDHSFSIYFELYLSE